MKTFTYRDYHVEIFRSSQDSRFIVATVNKYSCPFFPLWKDEEVASQAARKYVDFLCDVQGMHRHEMHASQDDLEA